MIITAIIPSFNRKEILLRLLDQLHKQTGDNFNLKIIVVDDGSTDGTSEAVTEHYPDIYLVKGTGSWWFTKRLNNGIERAKSFEPDYIITFNDDIEVPPNLINNLLLSFEYVNKDSVIGPISYSIENPTIITSPGIKRIVWWRAKTIVHDAQNILSDKNSLKILKSIEMPTRCLMVPWKVSELLNGFDECFPQYHSDGDFCLRAQKYGFEVYINYESFIYDHTYLTSKDTSYFKQNFLTFIKSFFNPYGRNYIPHMLRYYWRHGNIFVLPLTLIIVVLAKFKNFIKAFYKK